jgi:hypothetical protein
MLPAQLAAGGDLLCFLGTVLCDVDKDDYHEEEKEKYS